MSLVVVSGESKREACCAPQMTLFILAVSLYAESSRSDTMVSRHLASQPICRRYLVPCPCPCHTPARVVICRDLPY